LGITETSNETMKTVLAIDGSSYSEYAVKTVAERLWPSNTTVRVLTVIQDIPPPASELWYDASGSLERVNQELEKRAEGLVKNIAESLKPSGLNVELAVRHGDPRSVIVDEATEWEADLIVVGSHGYTGLKRLLLGSVSQSVVAHAPCSVEVVRPKISRSAA